MVNLQVPMIVVLLLAYYWDETDIRKSHQKRPFLWGITLSRHVISNGASSTRVRGFFMDHETTFFVFRDTLSQVRARVPHLGV